MATPMPQMRPLALRRKLPTNNTMAASTRLESRVSTSTLQRASTSPTRLTRAAEALPGSRLMPIDAPASGLRVNSIGGWPREFSTFWRRATIKPIASRSLVILATVCGLSSTTSTISLREIDPCCRIKSSTTRRLYGALDCCVAPRLMFLFMSIKIFCENYHDTRPSRPGRVSDAPGKFVGAVGAEEKHFLQSLFVFISDDILKIE